jgi:pyridoxal phosphate enzyme (YggS family)
VNTQQISERADAIRQRIERAAARTGRAGSEVGILPITKGHAPGVVSAVAEAGFEAVGENRVAEADRKRTALGDVDVRWHMVGHLQRNKAGSALRVFDRIDSVDSVRLGRRLQLEAERADVSLVPVLVQVNAAAEEQKSGLDPAQVVEVVGRLAELSRIQVRGLMTMAPYTGDEAVLRQAFSTTRECLARCQKELRGLVGRELSMGMSNDFEIAVEEGSTQVRLGTVLLGERPEVRWI